MRFFIAIICGWAWYGAMAWIQSKMGVVVSSDIQFLSLAIVVGGALAGGD